MALESSPSMCQKLKIPKSKEKLFNFIQNEKYRHQENIETYSITWFSQQQQKSLDCHSSYQAGLFATGEIRQNIKFVSFWCVVLTKIKVGPESW